MMKRSQLRKRLALNDFVQADRSHRSNYRKKATSAPGLTAETVIGALEDAEDYKGFEAAITAGFDERSAYLPAASYG
jgi:hypothetical protein